MNSVISRSLVATTASLLLVAITFGTQCLAKSKGPGTNAYQAASGRDWQEDQQLALQYEQDGQFEQAEKCFLRARKNLLSESKNAPPTSFSARWFPLQDSFRNLYLNRAIREEDNHPFAQIDQCYKKALAIPGSSYEMWLKYADFLRRHGKIKQAAQAEKDGKKKSLYSTNQQ